jgi:erythritol transport system permease protein
MSRRLPFGRHVYAIGDNERAAELSGVKVAGQNLVYTIRLLCGIGRDCGSAQLLASHPANGTAFEMNAIAAVVLGNSLAGGRGTARYADWRLRDWLLADGLVMMA